MFTYGYLREAALAHLDLETDEAQRMQLFNRFYVFCNEAMQAICGGKPKYDYVKAEVVNAYDPVVRMIDDKVINKIEIRKATELEISLDKQRIELLERKAVLDAIDVYTTEELEELNQINLSLQQVTDGLIGVEMCDAEDTKEYYEDNGIYLVGKEIAPTKGFISFANKQAWSIIHDYPSVNEMLEAEAFNRPIRLGKTERRKSVNGVDFVYIGSNKIMFPRAGRFLIPAKYWWFIFTATMKDTDILDMPIDVATCIPLYIAAKCEQIGNPQKANLFRGEFELALGRVTNTDFLQMNEVKATY